MTPGIRHGNIASVCASPQTTPEKITGPIALAPVHCTGGGNNAGGVLYRVLHRLQIEREDDMNTVTHTHRIIDSITGQVLRLAFTNACLCLPLTDTRKPVTLWVLANPGRPSPRPFSRRSPPFRAAQPSASVPEITPSGYISPSAVRSGQHSC